MYKRKIKVDIYLLPEKNARNIDRVAEWHSKNNIHPTVPSALRARSI